MHASSRAEMYRSVPKESIKESILVVAPGSISNSTGKSEDE